MARYMPSQRSPSAPAITNAMKEVHTNIPSNVKATGKTGPAKEKMLRAIAFSKASRGSK